MREMSEARQRIALKRAAGSASRSVHQGFKPRGCERSTSSALKARGANVITIQSTHRDRERGRYKTGGQVCIDLVQSSGDFGRDSKTRHFLHLNLKIKCFRDF